MTLFLRRIDGRYVALFTSVVAGQAELTCMEIVAITDGNLPHDDHDQLLALA